MKANAPMTIARSLWVALNERYLNIDTAVSYEGFRGPTAAEVRHQDNLAYHSPDYWYIRKMLRLLNPGRDDVVYDIGAGKGRIVCLAACWRVKKCVGIEVLPALCAAARLNAQQMCLRHAPIEIRCEDAATADLSDGTIYFLLNPFGASTLRDVMQNLKNSLVERPRRVRVVYYNSQHRDVLQNSNWLQWQASFSTMTGLKVDFYSAE